MMLPREFYNRSTEIVAQELLGKQLCRQVGDQFISGIITEVEAYFDQNDSASHASRGLTARNAVMFGPPGFSYVYFIYGMYNMFNIVTEPEGRAGAVLIRAIQPTLGVQLMIQARSGKNKDIANGPGKLCKAMQIDKSLHNIDLTTGHSIWLEESESVAQYTIKSGPRIGINYANEHDRAAQWRFWITF